MNMAKTHVANKMFNLDFFIKLAGREAIFEIRFASSQPWENMPGLLYAQICERYPSQQKLPLADLPEEFRRQDSALRDLPLLQFHSDGFLIQLGPRCVSLVTQPNAYPGWDAVRRELEWVGEHGMGKALSPKAYEAFLRFIKAARFPAGVTPSVFLTDAGGIEVSWESDDGQPVQVEFRREGAEYFLGATQTEGCAGYGDIDNIRRIAGV